MFWLRILIEWCIIRLMINTESIFACIVSNVLVQKKYLLNTMRIAWLLMVSRLLGCRRGAKIHSNSKTTIGKCRCLLKILRLLLRRYKDASLVALNLILTNTKSILAGARGTK